MMRKNALLACLGIGAAVSSAQADPMQLTLSQLDTVTAGAITVSARAAARAFGPATLTLTDTYTYADGQIGGRWGVSAEAGFSGGLALAALGQDRDTQLSLGGSADGELVVTAGRFIARDTPYYSLRAGGIAVVSANP